MIKESLGIYIIYEFYNRLYLTKINVIVYYLRVLKRKQKYDHS